MKQLLLYGLFLYATINSMDSEYARIKSLLTKPHELVTYLESQDAYLHTPLMRLLDKATDEQIQDLLPHLRGYPFNLEIKGPAQETAFFNACDRKTIPATVLMVYLGAKVNAQTCWGTPLFLAIINQNIDLIAYLLYEGASLNTADASGKKAADLAPTVAIAHLLTHKLHHIPEKAREILLSLGQRITGVQPGKMGKKRAFTG